MVVTTELNTSIQELVRRWGGSTTDAILDDKCSLFQIPSVNGLIGYRQEDNCAVVFGDPVCAPADLLQLVTAFHTYAQEQKWNVIYIVSTQFFTDWAIKNRLCEAKIEFGEEFVIHPTSDDPRHLTGTHASLVRRKVRRALKENITVQEYLTQDPAIEESLNDLGQKWLQARQGPQIHISHIHLFDNRVGKRWFYAEQNGQQLGVVVLNPLKRYQGYLLNHLMTLPDAPPGIPELLVIHAIETLSKENCPYLTFGTSVKTKLGEIEGLSSMFTWVARRIFAIAIKYFQLHQRADFWLKFAPHEQPTYLLFKNPHIGIGEIRSLMSALNVNF